MVSKNNPTGKSTNTRNPIRRTHIIISKKNRKEGRERQFSTVLQRALHSPQSITPADAIQLQQTIGNQALGRLLIQPKLTLDPVGDKYEQEADAVAKQVVGRISDTEKSPVQRQEDEEELQLMPHLQLKPISSVQRQEEEELQMKPSSMMEGGKISSDIEDGIQREKGSGQPLSPHIRTPMEQSFGANFSGVKIHTGGQSDQLNRSIQARAFTTGQDIFFRQGEYNPNNTSGKELLAHELTHVVQQRTRTAIQRLSIQERMASLAEHGFTDATAQKAAKTNIIKRIKDNHGIDLNQDTGMNIIKESYINTVPRPIQKELKPTAWTLPELQSAEKEMERRKQTKRGMATKKHQLEKADPQHREPIILAWCLNKWKPAGIKSNWDLEDQGMPPQEFFDFVTELEQKKDAELIEEVRDYIYRKTFMRDKLIDRRLKNAWKKKQIIPRILYIQNETGKGGRDQLQLKSNGLNISQTRNKKTKQLTGKYIYVMSPDMKYYAWNETLISPLRFHHSSFLGGQSVGAAGTLNSSSSYLEIDLESGHYQPLPQHMINALLGLKTHDVPLDKVKASPLPRQKISILATSFFKLIHILKTMSPQAFNEIKETSNQNKIIKSLEAYSYDSDLLSSSSTIIENAKNKDLDDMQKAEI